MTDPQPAISQIIIAEWIIPMTKTEQWLENSALVIAGSRIHEILNADEAIDKYPHAQITRLKGHALLPGFVNSHCHAAMNLLRGYANDLPLKQWLENAIWPVETKFVDGDFVYQGTQHAIAEMIKSGTTCFQDMYFMPDQAAKAAQEAGIRASIGLIVIDFANCWSQNAQEAIDKGLDVFDQYKHSQSINFNFAPHAPYTASTKTLEKVAMLSNELNLTVQIHVQETQHEVDKFVAQHRKRPLTLLKEIGLLSPLFNAVHMTQLNDTEIQWLAESGSHVVHCPQSNMILASGACPTQTLVEAKVNIAIGTDGAASNNDLNMVEETRTAAMLAKLYYLDATALPAYQALYMATMGGARALGLQNEIGSLEKGKAADFIAVDLNRIETQPVYNPISQIVYASGRDQVTHSWVNGKALMIDGKLTTLNPSLILQNVSQWQSKINAK